MAAIASKRVVYKTLAIFLSLQLASCGTILYPERRGQPVGYLDAGVVALDAVGLLLFLVPGVIAFAVDFATGTIYLPPERPYFVAPPGQPWLTMQVRPAELTPQRLEEIVAAKTGQPIHLAPGTYRAARISQIQDCTPTILQGLQAAPVSAGVVFRGSAE